MKHGLKTLLAAACLVGISMPAFAADGWTVYGESAVFMKYTMLSEEAGDSDTYAQSSWDVGDLGATYSSDAFDAKISVGINDGTFSGDNSASMGATWITAKLDGVSIKIGRDDPLSFNPIEPWRQKYGASGIGLSIGGSEHYQLTFKFPVAKGLALELMAAQPKEQWATRAGVSTEVKMPQLEARFGGSTGFPWAVWAGYESYDDTTNNDTITAYTVGAVVRPKLGPLATNFTLNYATNLYQGDGSPTMVNPGFGANPIYMGAWNYTPGADTDKLGAAFSASMMMTEKVGIGFGAGYQMFTADDGPMGAYEDPTMCAYFSINYVITENFNLFPYVVYEDYDTITLDGMDHDQGNMLQVGLIWKIIL